MPLHIHWNEYNKKMDKIKIMQMCRELETSSIADQHVNGAGTLEKSLAVPQKN